MPVRPSAFPVGLRPLYAAVSVKRSPFAGLFNIVTIYREFLREGLGTRPACPRRHASERQGLGCHVCRAFHSSAVCLSAHGIHRARYARWACTTAYSSAASASSKSLKDCRSSSASVSMKGSLLDRPSAALIRTPRPRPRPPPGRRRARPRALCWPRSGATRCPLARSRQRHRTRTREHQHDAVQAA
jgi:hypothetical protein